MSSNPLALVEDLDRIGGYLYASEVGRLAEK
ncbi:hypothetical protein EDE09_1138 [Neorhizobium sp. S3-V5DH]|nr:hypothetical protein EDE09_1138 [Neorhizobium sp. S3-V5DH]